VTAPEAVTPPREGAPRPKHYDRRSTRVRRQLARGAKRASPILALALVGAVAVIVATRIGGSGGSTTAQERAANVAACERTHGLSSAQAQRSPQPGETRLEGQGLVPQTAFVSCSWPPGPGADPDGYRAIVLTETNGPGQGNVSGRQVADRIESHCRTLQFEYTLGQTLTQIRIPAFRASPGDIWSLPLLPFSAVNSGSLRFSRIARIGTPAADEVGLSFYPGRNEVVVLHNDATGLDGVRCIA